LEHPNFRDTGPISECIVVFPRTAVRIQHENSRAFLADPTLVTIYNRGQRYQRFSVSPDGDRCDWFAISDELAREIAGTVDESAADLERPFRYAHSSVSGDLYLRQRVLMRRAVRGEIDLLEMEEGVFEIVAAVLRDAYRTGSQPKTGRRGDAVRRRREMVENARTELFRTAESNRSVTDIAAAVGASPWHLCRVFRAITGLSMHEYRNEIRIRRSLELLTREVEGGTTVSAIAHRLGFASHAHLVRAMRRWAGMTPREVRGRLSRSVTAPLPQGARGPTASAET
jgi:AraC-like DNA-binding protein